MAQSQLSAPGQWQTHSYLRRLLTARMMRLQQHGPTLGVLAPDPRGELAEEPIRDPNSEPLSKPMGCPCTLPALVSHRQIPKVSLWRSPEASQSRSRCQSR